MSLTGRISKATARRHFNVVGTSGVIGLAVVVGGLIVPQINHAAGRSLTAITVTPSNPTLNAGQTESFVATGTFSDGSTQVLNTGGGTWAATGSLATPRFYHSATLLQDGSVLVGGGYNSAGVTQASAERLYPASGTWVPAGSMASARLAHTATLLPNGKVLIAGGIRYPDNTVLNTTELYDPNTNSWSAGPPLALGPRSGHSAVLLVTGKVLVAAGLQIYPSCTYLASAELYDAAANTWTPTGSLSLGRSSATTSILANGKVLLAGGPDNNCPTPNNGLSNAEVYDPATGAWSLTGNLSMSRYSNTITLLESGEVLFGGGYSVGGETATSDLYDPATGTFALTGALPAPRVTISGTGDNGDTPLLQNGKVLVAGGLASGNVILGSAALYDPASGTWAATGSLATPRAYSTTTLLQDGKVLVAGGLGAGNITLTSAEVYDPQEFSWASTDGNVATITQTGLATGLVNGTTTITATSGSIIGSTTLTVADTIPPTTNASFPAPNANGWNRFNVFVSLNAFDSGGAASPSGVQSVTYSLSGAQTGGGTFNTCCPSFTISNEGTTTLTYHATDNNGNVEADHTVTINLDKTSPTAANLSNQTVQATSSAGAVVLFDLAAADSLSGIGSVSLAPGGLPSGSTFPHGTTNENFTITDRAGNNISKFFSITVNKTLLSIAVSPATASISVADNRSYQAIGHFTSGPDQMLPASGGSGGSGGGGFGAAWQVLFPLSEALPVGVCGGPSAGFTSQPFSASNGSGGQAMYGAVSQTWGSPASVQVGGTVTAAEVHLTLSCIPSNGVTGSIDALWTGTRFEGTWQLGGSSGHATIRGWSTKAPLSAPRLSLGAAAVNGLVYAIGGNNPSLPSPVEAYNPATDSWSTVSQLPVSSEGPGVAALSGIIYVAGGHVAGGNASGVFQGYNPATGSWVSGLPAMPTARAYPALVAAGGKLYAIGGSTGTGSATPTAVVERYDPVANEWATLASMSTPRAFHVAGALNGDTTIVAAGGSTSSTELYNIATNTWTAGPAMVFTPGSPAAAVVNNALFVVGVGGAQMFRPAGTLPSGWAGVAPMPTSRGQLGVAAVGDVIYAIGGMLPGGGAAIATVEAFSTPLPSNFIVSSGGSGGGGNSTPVVSWQSTNPSIAGISSSGFASGNAAGQTTIVATAGGVSCATTNTCGTLTVTEPGHLTLTLAPASAVFASVAVEIIDPSTGTVVEGPFNVPIGQTQSIDNESAFRLRFTPPAGYTVSPVTVDLTVHSGDNITVPLFFAVIDTTPPELTLPGNITVDATSPSGAVVTYSASATDSVSGPVTVTCVLPSGSTFAIGTSTVTCTSTDGAGNTAIGSFQVLVQAAAAQVANLIVSVQNFNLAQGISNSLDAKLQNILSALDAAQGGSVTNTCNQLGAFINQTAAQSGQQLTVAQADQLIAAATRIQAVIGCQ